MELEKRWREAETCCVIREQQQINKSEHPQTAHALISYHHPNMEHLERCGPPISILLTCDLEQNLGRADTEEHNPSGNIDLPDPTQICKKRETEGLYEFHMDNKLKLKITISAPTDAAQETIEWIANREWPRRHRDASRRTIEFRGQHGSIRRRIT